MKTNLEWALYYHSFGFAVFPVRVFEEKGKAVKRPLIKEWQKHRATPNQIKEWWTKQPNADIGIATGEISNLFVLDVDLGANLKGKPLSPTATVKTGSGGYHYYFQHFKAKTKAGIWDKIDVRSTGGFVVAPPSRHPKGKYEWVENCSLEDHNPLPKASGWLQSAFKAPSSIWDHPMGRDWKEVEQGVKEGTRNDTAAGFIGRVLYYLPGDLWTSIGWEGIKAWNRKNKPPLSEEELWITFTSVGNKENARRKGN